MNRLICALYRIRPALLPACLTLTACQSPPLSADSAQYRCPNGQSARVSLSPDQHQLRLYFGGRLQTLRWDENRQTFSNGRIDARHDEGRLRLEAPGLRLNCPLQIPASPKAATPQGSGTTSATP